MKKKKKKKTSHNKAESCKTKNSFDDLSKSRVRSETKIFRKERTQFSFADPLRTVQINFDNHYIICY